MNAFDNKLQEYGLYPLKAKEMSAVVVVMNHTCNLRCTHCYLEASPEKTEEMSLSTLNKILDMLSRNKEISVVNISGGSPEMHPHFRHFVKSATDMGKQVMVASNLVIYSEPGYKDIPEFYAENSVTVNASLPHYIEEEMEKIRGKGTYRKAIAGIKRLNELGYSKEGSPLVLNFLYSPTDARLSPDMLTLEKVYKEKLHDMHGITFNNLFTINNMPMGRFRKKLSDDDFNEYMKELEQSFNPATIANMMCRTSVSYAFDGQKAYDCDFWRILDMPVKLDDSGIDNFDYEALSSREVVTHPLCFMCTAGAGCACSDLLVE